MYLGMDNLVSQSEYAIRESFHLFMILECTKCASTYYPCEQPDWVSTGNLEHDSGKMVEEYTPKALAYGWSGDSDLNLFCPSCSKVK